MPSQLQLCGFQRVLCDAFVLLTCQFEQRGLAETVGVSVSE